MPLLNQNHFFSAVQFKASLDDTFVKHSDLKSLDILVTMILVNTGIKMPNSAIDIFDPTRLPEGPFSELYAYWNSKKDGDKLPTWSDINPRDITSLLPHVAVIGFEKNPLRGRLRLVGTGLVSDLGADDTNSYLDERPAMNNVEKRAFACRENRAPFFLEQLPLTWAVKNFKKYSVLALPISSDGIEVERILYMMSFT